MYPRNYLLILLMVIAPAGCASSKTAASNVTAQETSGVDVSEQSESIPMPADLRERMELLAEILEAGQVDVFLSDFTPPGTIAGLERQGRLESFTENMQGNAAEFSVMIRALLDLNQPVTVAQDGRVIYAEYVDGGVAWLRIDEQWFVGDMDF